MASAARGAAYALLTTGFVNLAAALFLYSRVDSLFVRDPDGNAAVLLAVQMGSGFLAIIGFLALLVGIVMFTIGPRESVPEAQAPPERIG